MVRQGLSALFRTFQEGPVQDLTLIRGELTQVRSLSTSAIVALQSSFFELEKLVRAQRDHLDGLVEMSASRTDELNIATFVREVGPLFRSLSELLGHVVGKGAEGARRASQ